MPSEQREQQLQPATDGTTAAPPSIFPAATALQAHGITTNQGGFTQLAGRDITIQHHYHSLPGPTVNILEILALVPNLRKIHLDILFKATDGTGIWLLKTENFLLWVDFEGNVKILWGSGIPGAGKSVLASIVIRDLEARAAAAGGNICVAYVYFRYSDAVGLTVRSVLEILVKQTVERHLDCAVLAEETYSQHVHERTNPTEAELWQLLDRFTKTKGATFYVLDALDEAPERLRVALIRSLASLNVRLFITSRPLKDVKGRFPDACSFPISAQEGDLDLHIKQEIENSSVLEELFEEAESSFRDEMISLVKKNCGGMFLHASLQLDAISRCTSTQDVIETLEAFPSEIDFVYRQTWNRICQHTPKNIALVKALLIWVLTAARSMSIDELRHAIATSPDTHKFERKRLVPVATLLTLCCGLVTVEEETKLVRLVHYTAKDTLEETLRDEFPHPHSLLAAVCMNHLAEYGFQDTSIASEEEYTAVLQGDPLLAYASRAWAIHARDSLNIPEIHHQTAEFISNCKAFPSFIDDARSHEWDIVGPLHILAVHHLPLDLLQGGTIGDPNVATKVVKEAPLKLASWHGNEGMVRDLLNLPDTQVNYIDRDGTSALMLAAQVGHESIVNMLLARPEIQVNMIDIFGRAALVSAALNGHEAIVSALLPRHDTQVNLVNSAGWSSLVSAVAYGHKGIVKLLLAHPDIDVNLANSVDGSGWTALMEAVSKGHEDIVKLLLERPEVEVNLIDSNGASAFLVAARRGRESIVKCFLARQDTRISLVNSAGWSALVLAIASGHEGTIKLLFAHPDIDGSGWAALMDAISKGCKGIIKLLLERPEIDVNLVDSNGLSAFSMAARLGYESNVKLILARPEVQVNTVDKQGWSALFSAIANGHKGIVKLLLQHPDINVNLASDSVHGSRWTALMQAAARGRGDIVALLLARPEIEVNLVDSDGESAFLTAAREGLESVVRLFLAHPQNEVNLVDNEGWSALMLASNEGHIGTVKLLLACPDIEVNRVDREGRSALRLAMSQGLEGIAKLILAHPDIQVNMADGVGCSPLMEAAYFGFKGVLSVLLVHHNIDINAVDDDGQSALMAAALTGHEGAVRLLLAHPNIRVDSVDNEGYSALMLAEREHHGGCVALLTTLTGS